jgi:hypothetical protein
LEKHEIAKDRSLIAPLTLVRQPPKEHDKPHVYTPGDPSRSHIMPSALSARGSMMWNAIDVKGRGSKWIERRSLSDQIVDLWK